MKLNRTTWLSLLLAIIFSGGVYGYELVRSKQGVSQANTTSSQQLFQLQEADIQQVVIEKPELTLELVKTGDRSSPWQLKSPQDVPANMGTVAFLLDLLASGKPQRTFIVSADKRSQYGLDNPIATVTFKSDNKSQQIILGRSGLNEDTIYAQIVSPSTGATATEVSLVSKNWQYAVERDLEAWKQSTVIK
ncbi:DUF4340 domain-containing protein [Myxosarcina sp. GI1]|uniref:DUF4340 domain-containing protein n=1 Tax=Myxosarcina sp. GI1 TaxID=1541065 RepID=UPI00055F4E2C|nr:DUF4340 domain-containing protein [Myxosarcina sp. GI1]